MDEDARLARCFFWIDGLSLRREFTCGQFTLLPSALLPALGSHLAPSTVGWYDLSEKAPTGDAYDEFAKRAFDGFAAHAEILDLLLSFANRRHVQVKDPGIYVCEDGQWVYRGGGGLYPDFHGAADGTPWYHGEGELCAFLLHAYPRMIYDFHEYRGGQQDTGLRLSLRLLDASRGEQAAETSFQHAATALEIMVNAADRDPKTVSKDRFAVIEARIRALLIDLFSEKQLTSAEMDSMNKQTQTLNIPTYRDRADDFLKLVLQDYPLQRVSRKDMSCFTMIRNAITHSGTMQDAASSCEPPKNMTQGYTDVLLTQYQRLVSLLEHVVLARLGYDAELMKIEWQDVRNT